jgi:hypothetical protein
MRIGIGHSLVATVLLAAVPSVAEAQGFNAFGGKSAAPSAAPRQPPPPALPGATPNAGRAAPSFRPPTDMEPTDALFDAINRGDIATARDAISRGADLNGRNILGMTPMELSVDLGRNDISFLLLSMRGADDGRSRPPSTTTVVKSAPTKPVKQATRPSATAAKNAAPEQRPATPQTAPLFSGDGGTPIPNAGFLGFDVSRR